MEELQAVLRPGPDAQRDQHLPKKREQAVDAAPEGSAGAVEQDLLLDCGQPVQDVWAEGSKGWGEVLGLRFGQDGGNGAAGMFGRGLGAIHRESRWGERPAQGAVLCDRRSEERRVGKECRSRW